MSVKSHYRGRFAPSPTGPLHFGSLVAAMGSYLQAKHQKGEWLVRIDDIDPPREQKGVADNILATLEGFGFAWDDNVQYQSKRQHRYQEAVDYLIEQHQAYPCSCSRTSIMRMTGETKGNIIYPGFCRNGPLKKSSPLNTRIRGNNTIIHFRDVLQGEQKSNIEKDTGDFVLQRRDHYFSYNLASGIDDAEQGISEVVRGADLLNCTPSQLYIQSMLNLSSPEYCHLPIALDDTGHKLSKQSHAKPINIKDSVVLLFNSLKFLGQSPPGDLINGNQNDVWAWAIQHWRLDLVPLKPQQTIY